MKIPFTNLEIVGHVPMAPPKQGGVPIANPTLGQIMANGGPLPLKVRTVQQQAARIAELPPQIPDFFAFTATPVTLPFDITTMAYDAVVRTMGSALARRTLTEQQKDKLVHQLLDKLVSEGMVGSDALVVNVLLNRVFSQQLREPDPDGRAPRVLRQHALPLLQRWKEDLLQLRRNNVEPPTNWDPLLLPLLIESENARTPGLGLRLVTVPELGKLLGDKARANNTFEGTFILDDQGHRVAVHAMNRPGMSPRFAALDGFFDPATRYLPRVQNSDALLRQRGDAVPVTLGIQEGQCCTILSLSIARKIVDHPNAVKRLYAPLDAPAAAARPNRGIHPTVPAATSGLPPAFFKQSQGRTVLTSLPPSDQQAPVNNGKETLLTRWQRHSVTRIDPMWNTTATYSGSVEIKRLEIVQEAIRHFRKSPTDWTS